MATPTSPPRPKFRRKRFFAGLLIVFLGTELAGTSLTLLVLALPELVRTGKVGGMDSSAFTFFASVGIAGLILTSIPAAIYSLVMVISFLRLPWTRKLPLAIAYAAALTLPAFVAGWILIMREILPRTEEENLLWPLAIVSLVSAAVGAWVLHRYFKIVERHDRAA